MRTESRHTIAVAFLISACIAWGPGFPLMKALLIHQAAASGETGRWVTMQALLVRFGGAGVLLFALAWWKTRRLSMPTREEWYQAAVCGTAVASGLFLSIDALSRTSASTVGFLSQCYVVTLPMFACLVQRRWPSVYVTTSVILTFVGVAMLSGITLENFRPGVGEMMTIAASLVTMIQILALSARRWQGNDGIRVTWAMFLVMTLLVAPVVILTGPGLTGMAACYRDPAAVWVIATVVVVCTCVPYALMTMWQRFVSETTAGIIYCSEAVTTALSCLLLPGLVAGGLGITYANEEVTGCMLAGGGLIVAGCLLVQRAPRQIRP